MAALVQTLPVQTTTVTMLGRPSSSGGYPSQGSHSQMRHHQQPTRYNMPQTGYRGMPTSGHIAPPYAFTSTPQLPSTSISANFNARPFALNSGRSISSPKAPHPTASPSSQPTSPIGLPQIDAGKRLSLGLPSIPSGPLMDFPQPTAAAPKPSPDRYRRPVRRSDGEVGLNRAIGGSALPSGSGMAAVGSLYNHPVQSSSTPSLSSSSQVSYRSSTYGNSVQNNQKPSADDLQTARPQQPDRYRRRSFGSIDTAGLDHSSDPQQTPSPHPNTFLASPETTQGPVIPAPVQPPTHHRHTSSSDSRNSSRSARSSRPGSVRDCVANSILSD